MQTYRKNSTPSTNHLSAAAIRLAETRLLLLRSGIAEAREIADTLGPLVPKVESLQQLESAGGGQ